MVQTDNEQMQWGIIFFVVIFTSVLFAAPTYAVDTDSDGLDDEEEAIYYTDPLNPDTDGDRYVDGMEVRMGYSPHKGEKAHMHQHDYDGDGLNDWQEIWFKSDIGLGDSDGDIHGDLEEVLSGFSPADPSPEIKFERKIVVDKSKQYMYFYVDGINVREFPVSTGNPHTPTPSGTFQIQRKLDVARYVGPGYDLPGVLWNMEFKPSYFLHSAYWHNDFGKRTHSHGCVNMRLEDAALLYRYAPLGMTVEIIGETPKRYVVGT